MKKNPERTPEDIATRHRKAVELWNGRLLRRTLNTFDQIRDTQPRVFVRLICEGVLGIPFDDSDIVVFNSRLDKFEGERTGTQRTFRYLAELILQRLNEKKLKPDNPYVSLASWIEYDSDFQLDRFSPSDYVHDSHFLQGTAGTLEIYVSRIRWVFFNAAAEALNWSAMKAARMVYRGLPLFDHNSESGEFVGVAEGAEDYIYLKEKGKRGDVTTGYELPDWATRYYVKSEHFKLHDSIFFTDWDLSLEELELRRTILTSQCGTVVTPNRQANSRELNTAHLVQATQSDEIESHVASLRSFIAEDPDNFVSLVCHGVLGISQEGVTNPILEMALENAADVRGGLLTRVYELNSYLASLILSTTNAKPKPKAERDTFVLIKQEIEENFSFDRISCRPDAYERPTLYDTLNTFFSYQMSSLGSAVADFTLSIYYGLPIYERSDQDFKLVPLDHGHYSYLFMRGKYYDHTDVSNLPDWANCYYIKPEDQDALRMFFDTESVLSEDEISKRRDAFRRHIGISNKVVGPNDTYLSNGKSKLSLILVKLIDRYYGNQFDPDDADTWPKQADVVAWLKNQFGLTGREAEALDIVSRPDRARRK